MALEPQVFMFDEPTAGMSVDEVPVDPRPHPRPQGATATRPSCWSSTRWTWCAARRPHRRAAQRHAGGRRRAGRRDRLADRAGGLSRRAAQVGAMHERRCSWRCEGVHTHIGPLSHPARRRLRGAGGRSDDAARPQRRRQDHDAAHHHGPVAAPRSGSIRFDGARHHAARHARHRARRHRLRAGEPWASSPTSRCARTCCWRRAAGPLDGDAARLDLRPVSRR